MLGESGVLPTSCNPARRMATVGKSCAICGAMEKSNVRILLECPFAELLWEASGMNMGVWAGRFRSVRGCIEEAMKKMDQDALGLFVATMAKCWAARNKFIF